MSAGKPKIGISSCLLGEEVRYDGGHKRQAGLIEALGPMVEWVPVCPEVEAGMGVPREPINLVGDPAAPRLIGEQTGRDWTETMRTYAERRVRELIGLGLSGYILKNGSPSCGLREVPVLPAEGTTMKQTGRGMFAAILIGHAFKQMPDMPIEDEERLRDPARLEDFLGRVLAYHERYILKKHADRR